MVFLTVISPVVLSENLFQLSRSIQWSTRTLINVQRLIINIHT